MTPEELQAKNAQAQKDANEAEFKRNARLEALRVAKSSHVTEPTGDNRPVNHTEVLGIADKIYEWLIKT